MFGIACRNLLMLIVQGSDFENYLVGQGSQFRHRDIQETMSTKPCLTVETTDVRYKL